ncbi:RRP15-like protein [Acanthaster planci]|uniref:RRP15-like protein n=1 Tax=Acanthaster planci TaxID=133434 RepID=A0A8B7YDX9_ACAPL|nr:RRP15-like protein [Acanthaster planci]
MAADMSAHGPDLATTAVSPDNVVSFVNSDATKKQNKNLKRWRPFVKVSYDSGSDADVESDEDRTEKGTSSKTTSTRISRKRQKLEGASPPASPASEHPDSDGESRDSEEDPEGEEEPRVPGAGWADAMAKILQRDVPGELGSAVLAKSKDYQKAKQLEEVEYAERRKEKEMKDQWENMGRVKPRVTDKELERKLQRIATRGVVQLFNAVKKQQKKFREKPETAGSERKHAEVKSSVSKGDFLDLLKATPVISNRNASQNKQAGDKPANKKPAWSVLRDDFMMGATMKDWDKQSDSGSEEPGGGDSEGNSFSDSD